MYKSASCPCEPLLQPRLTSNPAHLSTSCAVRWDIRGGSHWVLRSPTALLEWISASVGEYLVRDECINHRYVPGKGDLATNPRKSTKIGAGSDRKSDQLTRGGQPPPRTFQTEHALPTRVVDWRANRGRSSRITRFLVLGTILSNRNSAIRCAQRAFRAGHSTSGLEIRTDGVQVAIAVNLETTGKLEWGLRYNRRKPG